MSGRTTNGSERCSKAQTNRKNVINEYFIIINEMLTSERFILILFFSATGVGN